MGTPWIHWNAHPAFIEPSPKEVYQANNPHSHRNRALRDVVNDYVESVSDHEPRLPEPVELDAISQYARQPELLKVIVQAIAERLTRPYPWNIKALDILEYLLAQSSSNSSTSRQRYTTLLPYLSNLYYNPSHPSDLMGGGAPHVKSKADSCLVRLGHELDPIRGMVWKVEDLGYNRNGGFRGGFSGWKWGKSEERRTAGRSRDWVVPEGSIWGTTIPQPGRAVTSAWTDTATYPDTPLGFSISTTTVSPGSPTLHHFRQHERSHAKVIEDAEAERRLATSEWKWWTCT